MPKFAPVGVLTRFVTTDGEYGGMALAWLNGPISGVTEASAVGSDRECFPPARQVEVLDVRLREDGGAVDRDRGVVGDG